VLVEAHEVPEASAATAISSSALSSFFIIEASVRTMSVPSMTLLSSRAHSEAMNRSLYFALPAVSANTVKEKVMKWSVFAFGVITLVTTGVVAAQETHASQGKTLEQVREELVQAWRDGLLPYKRYEYPPSDATIARNKQLYAITHPEDVAVKEASAHAK
jgi:hypothetical protein